MKTNSQSGQSLLEILIALSASVMILSAIAAIVISSLNNTQLTKNQNLANQYAQEGIEVIRKIRDSSWINFTSSYPNGRYCLPQGSIAPVPIALNCPQNVGIFVRQIDINHNDSAFCPGPTPPPVVSSGSKVTLTTSWADGKCPTSGSNTYCHKVVLITCFHNLNLKKAP